MRVLGNQEFLAWLRPAGIGIDPRYAADWPRNIKFRGVDLPRYWITPTHAAEVEPFIVSILDAAAPWSHCYLWPKAGGWLADLAEDSPLCRELLRAHPAIGNADGAVEFGEGESDLLVSLMFCACAFGWSWPNDLFIVTDRRDVILMIDHHQVIWAMFNEALRREAFVASMSEAGFELPTSPPDPTFRAVPGQDAPK